ncbi:MAG: SDR family NAD(P)-dependent oxidoreductase, partial [Alphaproteobacteria bacterium]|nr:SDR family NAD(P)-dependent oxidoreductase [Alphaproteobacteria bacterium]
ILRVRSGRMQACNLQRMPFPMRTIASASAARGGGGRIINMMSPAAHGGGSLSVAYSARRAGVIHWAESAGSNLNARGITVTAIASGGMGAEHQTGVGTVFAGTEDKAPRPTTAEPRTATELADPARLPALAAAACILVQPQDKDGGSSRMN